MGFGHGGSQARSGIKRYNNSMAAHVWAAQSERSGQSNNGNVYFEGRALYSYGSHFLTGFIMPDGTALLNAESYSVSTSGHQSDAAGAVRHMPRLYVPELTAFRDMLSRIAAQSESPSKDRAERIKAEARRLIEEHAERLAQHRVGEYRWQSEESKDSSAETAGAYLTRAAGLPARSWPALAKRAAAAKAKREKAEAKAEADRAKAEATRAADMTDAEFRRLISVAGESWIDDGRRRIERVAKQLFHAVRTAKVLGFSNRRRSIISARHKAARARLAEFDSLYAIVTRRKAIRGHIATIRGARSWAERLPELSGWQIAREGEDKAAAFHRLSLESAFPFATRRRLAVMGERLKAAAYRLSEERKAAEEAERLARIEAQKLEAEEHKRQWLAGAVPLLNRRFDAETGGAALRIKDDRLETSHGATVPLRHAVRAFRFVKLCRQAGRTWQRNGERIRVGSFEIDSIDESGNMIAGCHAFTWPEIERAAEAAGVVNDPPSAEAIEHKSAAA